MAVYFPQSTATFSQIHGVGRVKVEKYAEHFLTLICDYCTKQAIKERNHSHVASIATPVVKLRSLEVGARFRAGETVAALQQHYAVQRYRILYHLDNFVQAGQPLSIARLQAESSLSQAQQVTIMRYFAELGIERLRPIFEAMAEQVPYEELLLQRALYRLTEQEQPLACALA